MAIAGTLIQSYELQSPLTPAAIQARVQERMDPFQELRVTLPFSDLPDYEGRLVDEGFEFRRLYHRSQGKVPAFAVRLEPREGGCVAQVRAYRAGFATPLIPVGLLCAGAGCFAGAFALGEPVVAAPGLMLGFGGVATFTITRVVQSIRLKEERRYLSEDLLQP